MHITRRSDGKFAFDISNAANYARSYDFIVSLLLDILDAKPSDQVEKRRQIGFILSAELTSGQPQEEK
jgi:hypothetical protein